MDISATRDWCSAQKREPRKPSLTSGIESSWKEHRAAMVRSAQRADAALYRRAFGSALVPA